VNQKRCHRQFQFRRFPLTICVLIASLSSDSAAQRPAAPAPEQLYDAGRWFELREALQGQEPSALFRGALASAFNRVEDAERDLREAITRATDTGTRNEARGVLAKLYLRLGRSSAAGRLIDEIVQSSSQPSGIENVRVMFDAFSDRPNQTRPVHEPATFRCEVNARGVHIPLRVNDRAATWLLDTAANVTLLSQAEAKRLGVGIEDARSRLGDLAGGTTTARTARLRRLVIGRTELRDVAVVLPDSQPPFSDLPEGRRGLIGLPVALALGTVGWTRTGTCQTGQVAPRTTHRGENLVFHDFQPITRVAFDGQPLDFVLDTGNQAGTQLWERFRREFATLVNGMVARARGGWIRSEGLGNTRFTSSPSFRFASAVVTPLLKPAIIFSRPVGDEHRHGKLGMDVLSQATNVTIDFGSMVVTLR
jgi:Aspartyl protease